MILKLLVLVTTTSRPPFSSSHKPDNSSYHTPIIQEVAGVRDIVRYLLTGRLYPLYYTTETLYHFEYMVQNQTHDYRKYNRSNTSNYKEYIRVENFVHIYSVATFDLPRF